jgi:hypothetical protein
MSWLESLPASSRPVWAGYRVAVRYLVIVLGAGDQDVLRWFTLVVSILLDPATVLLLLAATRR